MDIAKFARNCWELNSAVIELIDDSKYHYEFDGEGTSEMDPIPGTLIKRIEDWGDELVIEFHVTDKRIVVQKSDLHDYASLIQDISDIQVILAQLVRNHQYTVSGDTKEAYTASFGYEVAFNGIFNVEERNDGMEIEVYRYDSNRNGSAFVRISCSDIDNALNQNAVALLTC